MVLGNIPHTYHNGITTVTQPRVSRPPVIRKKFAKPPVKVACLACRASRTRCDGQDPCSNCLSKDKSCSYLPSKRGGPRKKKKSLPAEGADHDDGQTPSITPTSAGFDQTSEVFGQIDVLSVPGAGLRNLDFPSEVQPMFADFFVQGGGSNGPAQMEPTPSPSSISSQSWVRTYGSEHDILNAYYIFIHHYFPILPPRTAPLSPDNPLDCVGSYSESPSEEPILMYRPCSPLSLAISAIMALVPHPNDPESSSPISVIRRRTFAQTLAQMANASVESDCELHASSTNPSQALSSDRPIINREKFHPKTPVELESILALLVLAIYEYTQRGNLLKMRVRAGQALAISLDMSLHCLNGPEDEFAEARRRAWWMTYYCVLQGSIVSTTPLAFPKDPQFTTPYPRFFSDPDGWSVLIQAQQVLVAATQFIIDLNKCLSTRTNMQYIFERMQQLDSWASSVLTHSALLPMTTQSVGCDDDVELTTAQSIRAISRIKLSSAQIKIHRFRAFSDIPLFIKKHCDLTAANASNTAVENSIKTSKTADGITNLSCACSTLDPFQQQQTPSTDYPTSSSAPSDYQPLAQYFFTDAFPFNTQHSAKVCLKASITISRMFQSLPMPQPIYDARNSQHGLQQLLPSGQTQTQPQLPRTMPSFACCLMQASYAMLMIFYKSRVEKQSPLELGNTLNYHTSDRLIEELKSGLEAIIATILNYAIAFEALDGMKDEIEGAYHTAFSQA